MRYFTSNPLERLMMQAPPPRQEQRAKPAPPKDHPCHGCKRCGESCVLPCYRGVEVIPPIPVPVAISIEQTSAPTSSELPQ